MKKILLTATVQSHIAQFHKPLINMLKENGYEVHVAARDNLKEKNGLKLDEPNKVFDIPFDRSPLSFKNIKAYKQLKSILGENEYNVVHCNTPMGGIITRLAAIKYRKKGLKVFYTAHGFHFYRGAPLKNWLIYYPIEKWFSKYTDKLITITNEDYKRAKTHFRNTEVAHIHGVGVDPNKYFPYEEHKIFIEREEKRFSDNDFICLCVGELNKNKNQKAVIQSLSKLMKEFDDVKLLIAGNGPMEENLKKFSIDLKISERVFFLGYRTDLVKYINICDVVVSASLREGLPLNIMEAMLCGKPVVVSNNRGHRELVTHKENGFINEVKNVDGFEKSLRQYYENKETRVKYGDLGRIRVNKFTVSNVIEELKIIYEVTSVK